MPELTELRYLFTGGYYPNTPVIGASQGQQATIRAGNNCWLRGDGRIEVANGVSQTSSTAVGARIFQFNTQRAEIEGALVSGRLPYAGLLRYQNAVMFYLSELASKQVYLDETSVTGLTTSASAGMLRIGIPGGSWSVYDAGFNPPVLAGTNVSTPNVGSKDMLGYTGVSLCAWRTITNAISAPSNVVYKTLDATNKSILIDISAVSTQSGQDGWIYGGTGVGDGSGTTSVVRYIRITPRGTFTATNGSPTLAGSGTLWTQDLRPNDYILIGAVTYTVLSVDSDTQVTLTANFGEPTGSGKTATITKASAEWYNGELGTVLSRDVYKPVKAAGVFSYAGRAFLWGCYGQDASAVTGPAIVPLLQDNTEHTGAARNTILTSNGDDILNVSPGETRLFVMTTNTLESVTFTADTNVPYKVRVLYQPGFKATRNGCVFQDQFYGYSNKPLRTVVDDNIDTEFGLGVWSAMKAWTPANVVVLPDPVNMAVLYCHYDGVSATTVIPWMVMHNAWGPPHTVSNQITDGAVVNGGLYVTVNNAGAYKTYGWETGTTGTASSPYVTSQFLDTGDPAARKTVKSLVVNGKTSNVRAYRISPAGTYPDLTSTGAATATFSTSSSEKAEKEIRTHIPECRALALRVDFPTAGTLDSLAARGYVKGGVV